LLNCFYFLIVFKFTSHWWT